MIIPCPAHVKEHLSQTREKSALIFCRECPKKNPAQLLANSFTSSLKQFLVHTVHFTDHFTLVQFLVFFTWYHIITKNYIIKHHNLYKYNMHFIYTF
ncbi:hypothetical protein BRADI_4g36365v3 [Brachypodium distachyon]|uniref:Uncharacterized protein n=1 Tax=Brachypodium distachyon TaxID=15368 RepID=A0A2K2CSN4_BRADI|nr:hypothetical protein BRADI_4g36365v3 [Brachypodium distachyon]